jgi:threonine/homoserine/homoserine lactone efflux protein
MLAIETLITFSLAALLLSISPGPSNLYIMTQSMGQGHQAGIAAAGGMAFGSFIYVLASAFGIAAVFIYSPLAYTVLKLVGAIYLIYLGVRCFLSAGTSYTNKQSVKKTQIVTIFRQSIIVELTNPKTALFFLAFLPQFVDPQAGMITTQLVILGTVYSLIAFGSDIMVALLSGKLGKWLAKHEKFTQWQERFSGGVLITLGGFIAYQELGSEFVE